ncbi:hypothetical protein H5410_003064 [Solanum commersonii]|uniref:Uncharacterized protein n=1 Tax=Solanum commersonii TaxID=4109 RepID=A0A9J6B3Z9_SOLCO|nr:hypothetical protein H5410_003064 [Solanum commersonii]
MESITRCTDTIEHIFNNGHFATYVWKALYRRSGLRRTTLIMQPHLAMVVTKYTNEAHKLLLQATPIFICWNLWKKLCM